MRNETSSADSRSMCAVAMLPNLPAYAPHRHRDRRLRGHHRLRRIRGFGERLCRPAPSTADRAFDDLAAQVDLGPRPSGTARGPPGREADPPWSRACRRRAHPHPAPVSQRDRKDPGLAARHRGRRRPLRHQERDPAICRRQRRRLRCRGAARARPNAPAPAARAVGAARVLRRGGGPRRPRLRRGRHARQSPVRPLRTPRASGLGAARLDRRDGSLRHGR